MISGLDKKWKSTFRTNQGNHYLIKEGFNSTYSFIDSKLLERLIKTLHVCLQKCDNLPLTIIKVTLL